MDDRISVIVSTYKRKEKLGRLLESFRLLRCVCPLEFIIVDSASCDGTEDIVNNWIATIDFAEVKYHVLPERASLAHTRNVGISLATGNIIAFTDDDCVVDPGWLDHLHERLIRCPEYAGVGGRVLPGGNDLYSRYFTIYKVLEPPHDLKAVIGANCMFWKQPVIDAGLFDEYFITLGGEETALCMKLGLNGYRFGFEELAVVYHEYRQSLKDFITTFYYYGNGDKVIYTHSLNGYLRYRQYPEKIYNSVAFRNHALFLLLFFKEMVYIITGQREVLRRVTSSRKERLMLNCLYAIHQVSFHLGRGTFFGTLSKTVERYLADNPDCLLAVDSDAENSSPVLEIVSDLIPPVLKPGEIAESSITIKNPRHEHFISVGFVIIIRNEEDQTIFYKTPHLQYMVLFPMTEMVCHFSLQTPVKEQKVVLQVFIATPEGALLSNKREKTITISSEISKNGKKRDN